MPKYLISANYTEEGLQGLLAKGGADRVTAVKAAAKSAGGKLESLYFAFGDTDVYAIVDLPSNTAAASLALTVAAAGAVSLSTTPLLTPEEIDEATKAKKLIYRPPGK